MPMYSKQSQDSLYCQLSDMCSACLPACLPVIPGRRWASAAPKHPHRLLSQWLLFRHLENYGLCWVADKASATQLSPVHLSIKSSYWILKSLPGKLLIGQFLLFRERWTAVPHTCRCCLVSNLKLVDLVGMGVGVANDSNEGKLSKKHWIFRLCLCSKWASFWHWTEKV